MALFNDSVLDVIFKSLILRVGFCPIQLQSRVQMSINQAFLLLYAIIATLKS